MLRKICTIGNSQGISIPKAILEQLHLKVGAEVEVDLDDKKERIIIAPIISSTFHEKIDKEFASQVNDFIEKYRPALKTLAS
jgi:putative addiction module antidote